jgi:hypothetical protein
MRSSMTAAVMCSVVAVVRLDVVAHACRSAVVLAGVQMARICQLARSHGHCSAHAATLRTRAAVVYLSGKCGSSLCCVE